MIKRDILFSPVQKIVFLIFSSLLSITFDNQKILIGYFVICCIIFLFAKMSVAQFKLWLFSILLTFWGTLLSQSMFYHQVPRTVIFQIISKSTPVIGPFTNGINIYREGLEYGIIQGMRFAITLTCGLFICFSTESKDLLKAAMRLKIPANIGFMLSISLRFIGQANPSGWLIAPPLTSRIKCPPGRDRGTMPKPTRRKALNCSMVLRRKGPG